MAPKLDPWVGAFGAGPVNYVRNIFQPKVDPNAWRTDQLSGAIGARPAAILRALTGSVGRPAAAAEMGRPEGSMATLGGKPVQWMDNQWVPFMTEGEIARAQAGAGSGSGSGGRPEGSMATLGGKPVQWMGNQWVPFMTEGEIARAQQARIQREAPPAPQLPPPAPGFGSTPIVRGTRDGVTPDRTQSDEYLAQLAQYGALSKAGKQEEAEKLGMEIWQQKYGKTAMGQPGGAVGAFNPLMQKTFGYQKGASETAPSYAGSTVQPMGGEDFAMVANAVPAPWNQQGAKVSADFSGVVPFQAAKTTGEGMPAFQTTGERAAEFLRNAKLSNLF